MNNLGILSASILIGSAMIASAWILRPASSDRHRAQVQHSVTEIKEHFGNQFIDIVRREMPRFEYHQKITDIEVDMMTISPDGQTLTIIPSIAWTKQDKRTDFACRLKADGFGGFIGSYSPNSNGAMMIPMQLVGLDERVD